MAVGDEVMWRMPEVLWAKPEIGSAFVSMAFC
jgi:hypothetical protein